jgi:hypothetical protein
MMQLARLQIQPRRFGLAVARSASQCGAGIRGRRRLQMHFVVFAAVDRKSLTVRRQQFCITHQPLVAQLAHGLERRLVVPMRNASSVPAPVTRAIRAASTADRRANAVDSSRRARSSPL